MLTCVPHTPVSPTPAFVLPPLASTEQGVRDANPYMTSLSSFLGFAVYGGQGVLLGPLIVCLATLLYSSLAWFLRKFCGEEENLPDSGGGSGVSCDADPDLAHRANSGATWILAVASHGETVVNCYFCVPHTYSSSPDECQDGQLVDRLVWSVRLSNAWLDSCREGSSSPRNPQHPERLPNNKVLVESRLLLLSTSSHPPPFAATRHKRQLRRWSGHDRARSPALWKCNIRRCSEMPTNSHAKIGESGEIDCGGG